MKVDEKLLDNLAKTKFRGSFKLNKKMIDYCNTKGLEKIESDAYELVKKRLSEANIPNDGKQTPMKQVHPVFIAEHACGLCCRGCMERIHHIEKNRELTPEEIDYVVATIIYWIKKEIK